LCVPVVFVINHRFIQSYIEIVLDGPPNGLRYPLVGGTGEHHFNGINSKPRKLPENAQTPTSRVHAVLGGLLGSRRIKCCDILFYFDLRLL
jgi:hypothetical protein